MMYSDYLALSACAFSVVYVPFFIIAQMRFAHAMQGEGYSNKCYFQWIRRNFFGIYAPLIGICATLIMAEVAVHSFIYQNSLFFDMDLLIAFVVVTMLVVVMLVILLWMYVKHIKLESEMTPLVCSRRLLNVYTVACLLVMAMIVLVNVFKDVNRIVFVLPLLAPLLVPFANLLVHGKENEVRS